jgi:predicted ferric reductase
MSEQLAWYVARSSGIVALVLSTLAVAWGLLFSTRLLQGRPSPKWLLDLHRFLGGLTVVFTAVHVAALVADNYVAFGPVDILVPFAASWQPEAVAWGVVAMYLLVAVEGTSLVMKRLPRRFWRGVHFASYAMFWLAVFHGARAGTDAGHPAYVAGSSVAVMLVTFLSAYRVLAVRKARRPAGGRSATPPRLERAGAAAGSRPRPAPAAQEGAGDGGIVVAAAGSNGNIPSTKAD